MINWTTETRTLAQLSALMRPDNPRWSSESTAKALGKTLDAFGQPLPILVDAESIIDGHQRISAWMSQHGGGYEVEVKVSDTVFTRDMWERFVLAFHEGATGEWDFDELANTFDYDGLAAVFDEAHLDQLRHEIAFGMELLGKGDDLPEPSDAEADVSRADELRDKWGVELGQVWRLPSRVDGQEHRIICGDCTDGDAVERVMGGEKADIEIHDPHYGMHLDTDWSDAKSSLSCVKDKGILGGKKYDNVIGDFEPYDPSFLFNRDNMPKELFLWGFDYYAERIPMRNDGSIFVWDKRLDESADKIYGSGFELCWSLKRHKRDLVRVKWAGLFGMEQEPDRTRLHPTQKPVLLYTWFLEKYSDAGGITADYYLGAGSHLLAAENLSRQCRAAEISPSYVAVALQRYEDAFGITPELIGASA